MDLKPYYENLDFLHVNTMPYRSYYVPLRNNGEEEIVYLNGDDWKFKFYNNRFEVDESFTCGDITGFDTISVPSCWNMLGYEKNCYANVNAPHPFIPPYVLDENPCGAYVKEIDIKQEDLNGKTFLNFDGVDSCFYLYINNEFVGYSQISHATSEFDVTKYLKSGKNIIAVLVLKWCSGTYFEDQDKFRMSGIFRDVYMIHRPINHVRDYTIKTVLNEDFSFAEIIVSFEWYGKAQPLNISFFDINNKTIFHKNDFCGELLRFKVEDPLLWSAENPNLYALLFETTQEKIIQKVGIKKVEIKNSVLYLNGKNIKLKGVNRHDSNAYTGYAISKNQLLQDLTLMKEHNVNAIRTSHYPSAPWAYDMYSELGFYVMTEANIECHNAMSIYGGGHLYNSELPFVEDYSFGDLCHDPQFSETILDRVKACVIREKNAACVFMYSLGNESGYGPNMEKAAQWIKTYDSDALIHYESSVYQKVGYNNDVQNIDVYSRMYISTQSIKNYCENSPSKPFIHCEYSHSMGNSCGDLEEYYNTMYAYDEFSGGFVWEWCDHAIYMGKTTNGKDKFFYGGDFGEYPSDGNFCVDGMISPKRKAHTNLLEFKNVNRPARAKLLKPNIIEFENMLDFTNLSDEFDVQIEQVIDNKTINVLLLTNLNVEPREKVTVEIEYDDSGECDNYLLIKYLQNKPKALTTIKHVAGFDQIILSKTHHRLPRIKKGAFNVKETERKIIVSGNSFSHVFDKYTAGFDSLMCNNVEYTVNPMQYNIWRAPIDNDRKIKKEWLDAGYNRSVIKVFSSEVIVEEDCVKINYDFCITANIMQKIIVAKSVFTIFSDGNISIGIKATKDSVFPELPRFGVRFFVPKDFCKVCYKGYGPYESYSDKRNLCYYGKFDTDVKSMYQDYLKPQEHGSRFGCKELLLINGKNNILISSETFSFSTSYFTQETLTETAHNFELIENDFITLCIDYKNAGIGSSSCGQSKLNENHTINENEIQFDFNIIFNQEY